MDLVCKVGIHFYKPEAPTLKYLIRPKLSKLPFFVIRVLMYGFWTP